MRPTSPVRPRRRLAALPLVIALPLTVVGHGAATASVTPQTSADASASAPAAPPVTTGTPAKVTALPLVPAVGSTAAPAARAGRPVLASIPMRTTAPFATVAVTWTAAEGIAPLAVSVRTRSAGRWSAWTGLEALELAPEQGPGGPTRTGTSPLFVGSSDGVQVEVRAAGSGTRPADLAVQLIDPGTAPATAATPRLSAPMPRASAAPALPSAPYTTLPNVVTRKGWGADESRMTWPVAYQKSVKTVFLHHTASSNAYYSREQAVQQVRAIYAYHATVLGWGDIGYPFLVDRFGTVYEGRAGGISKAPIGAHTHGFNASETTAVSLLGTTDKTAPSAVQMIAVARVMAYKLGQHHRDPLGRQTLVSSAKPGNQFGCRTGTVSMPSIAGHRDVCSTECPGAAAYSLLPALRTYVAALMVPRIVEPAVTAKDAGASIAFTLPTGQVWAATVKGPGGGVVWTSSGINAGVVRRTWDGRDARGALVPPGTYTWQIENFDGRVLGAPARGTLALTRPLPQAEEPQPEESPAPSV